MGRLYGSTEVLQLKVKEQREELAASRRELKGVKRAMRTLEVGAPLAGKAVHIADAAGAPSSSTI